MIDEIDGALGEGKGAVEVIVKMVIYMVFDCFRTFILCCALGICIHLLVHI